MLLMGDHSNDEGLSLIDGILPSELLNECEDENYGVEGKWNYLLMAFVVVKLRNPELGPYSQRLYILLQVLHFT
jgi:hypothetical protein